MFLLGNPLWTVTGAGTPAPEPKPEEPVEQPRGRAAWLADLPRRERSDEEVRRERQRFGVIPPDAEAVIDAVAARQALAGEQDEQKRFDELLRELELRSIEFEARYLDALAATRQRLIEQVKQRQLDEGQDLLILMMLAAVAAGIQ